MSTYESIKARLSALGISMDEVIIRKTRVDRSRTSQQVVDATGCKQNINPDALATMPQGEGEYVDVYFITSKSMIHYRPVSWSEGQSFIKSLGLRIDPRAQAAVNEADPGFCHKHPNVTLWDGGYLMFEKEHDGRSVECRFYDQEYESYDNRYFCGVLAPM